MVRAATGHMQYAALAGWQPIIYSKTAARLLKAAWCLLRIATPCAVLRRLTEVARRPAACAALPNGQEFDCVQTTAEQFHAVSECYAMCQVVGKITTLALTMQFMLPGWVSVSATAFPGEGAGLRSSELVVPNRGYGCPDCRPASQLCGEAPSVYDRDRQGARDLATSSPGSCSSVWT